MDRLNTLWLHAQRKQKQHSSRLNKIVLEKQGSVNADQSSFAYRTAYHVLKSKLFEVFFAAIILVNLVLVVIETDGVARDDPPPVWVDALSWVILVTFVFEIGFRVAVLGTRFWDEGASVAEFVIVVVDLFCNLAALGMSGNQFSVSFLRVIRLLKLVRAAKVFKVFPELRLMLAALMGSIRAIFWGTVLVAFMLLLWSILAVQFINPLNEKIAEAGEYRDCERCPRAFASVFHAFVTFFQQIVAGDNWGNPTVALIEHHPATSMFFVLVFVTVGLAALNLILGVVVHIASESRDELVSEIEDERILETIQAKSNLIEMFQAMDSNNDGEISKDELDGAFATNVGFQEAIRPLGIDDEDVRIVWTLLDSDKSGSISYAEFVANLYKMKMSNTHFMLAYVKFCVTEIKHKICEQLEDTKNELLTKSIEEMEDTRKEIIEEERKLAGEIEADLFKDSRLAGESRSRLAGEIEAEIQKTMMVIAHDGTHDGTIQQDAAAERHRHPKTLAGTMKATSAGGLDLDDLVTEALGLASPQTSNGAENLLKHLPEHLRPSALPSTSSPQSSISAIADGSSASLDGQRDHADDHGTVPMSFPSRTHQPSITFV